VRRRPNVGWSLLAWLSACGASPDSTVTLPREQPNATSRHDEPPMPLGPTSIDYPPALAGQRIGGTVLLRLFVDSAGKLVVDSTKIQESSGYPALDSAALRSAPRLQYAPALRNGVPVATPFLQPFNFRTRAGGALTP
jgi:TonB family protein